MNAFDSELSLGELESLLFSSRKGVVRKMGCPSETAQLAENPRHNEKPNDRHYDPYGRVTKVQGDLDADFGFTGDYFHKASGLDLTLYRAYDPNTGKWLSRDPLPHAEMRQGPNLYTYVGNHPVNLSDPSGRCVPVVAFTAEEVASLTLLAVLTYEAYKVEQNSGVNLAETLAAIRAHNLVWHTEEWKPKTRAKAPNKMGGQDCPPARGKKLTPDEKEAFRDALHKYKAGTGRGGADNLDEETIDEILDDILEGN